MKDGEKSEQHYVSRICARTVKVSGRPTYACIQRKLWLRRGFKSCSCFFPSWCELLHLFHMFLCHAPNLKHQTQLISKHLHSPFLRSLSSTWTIWDHVLCYGNPVAPEVQPVTHTRGRSVCDWLQDTRHPLHSCIALPAVALLCL